MPRPTQPPNFTGIWLANLEKSTLRGLAPLQIFHRIEHREPRIDQEMFVMHASGDQERLVFVYQTNGTETANSVGGRMAKACVHWNRAELVIESWLETPDRKFYFKDHWLLSADGQRLTMAHRGDDLAGQIVLHERLTYPPQGRSGRE